MKFFKSITRYILPVTKKQSILLLEQQQNLQKQSVIVQELSTKEKVLRSELQFIYSILIQRQGCRFKLFPMIKQLPLLLAVDHKITQMNFYLYIPSQQSNEIAQAYTNVRDDAIIIHELYVAPSHSNQDLHSFLLHEIKSEAKTLGLSIIYAR